MSSRVPSFLFLPECHATRTVVYLNQTGFGGIGFIEDLNIEHHVLTRHQPSTHDRIPQIAELFIEIQQMNFSSFVIPRKTPYHEILLILPPSLP